MADVVLKRHCKLLSFFTIIWQNVKDVFCQSPHIISLGLFSQLLCYVLYFMCVCVCVCLCVMLWAMLPEIKAMMMMMINRHTFFSDNKLLLKFITNRVINLSADMNSRKWRITNIWYVRRCDFSRAASSGWWCSRWGQTSKEARWLDRTWLRTDELCHHAPVAAVWRRFRIPRGKCYSFQCPRQPRGTCCPYRKLNDTVHSGVKWKRNNLEYSYYGKLNQLIFFCFQKLNMDRTTSKNRP